MMMDAQLVLLAAAPLWPLLIVAALLVPVLRAGALRLVPAAALPALLLALLPSASLELELPWVLLGTVLGLDDMSNVFLLLSAVLWTVGSLSLPKHGRRRFSMWFLVTMAGNFAVLLVRDIPSFFLSFAVMSLASFGLVLHAQTVQAHRAARVYLVLAILGEMVLLVALLLVAQNAGTLDIEHIADRTPQHLLIALLLIGFGIKAGVPLLHMALPPAYAVTPLAAAVPMAGALLHLGLYGWMRFLPLGQVAVPQWSAGFASIGLLAMFYGVIVGLTQREARPLLAYSSISQMGIMTLGVGIGLASPDHWPAVQAALLLFALHHALTKGALFHGLGIRGRARIALWLPALALAGLPFTGGALAKGTIKAQLHLLPEAYLAPVTWLLVAGSVGTALLMARFLYLARAEQARREPTSPLAWWSLLVVMLMLPWLWPLPLERSSPFWSALWPILLAAGLAWLAYRGGFRKLLSGIPAIPPGDLLVPVERLLQRIPWPRARHPKHEKEYDALLHPRNVPVLAIAPERFLGQWRVAVCLLVLLVLGLVLLLGRNVWMGA